MVTELNYQMRGLAERVNKLRDSPDRSLKPVVRERWSPIIVDIT